MDTWRHNAIRITKYNPRLRDANGGYSVEDWNSFDDIDKEFNGVKLEYGDYLKVEQRYIDAAKIIFNVSSCSQVIIKNIEKYSSDGLTDSLLTLYEGLYDGKVISIDEISEVIKLILRDKFWGELQCLGNDGIVVRFGYDLYMYVNGIDKRDSVWKTISETGLFVE